MSGKTALVRFGLDLRLADNPALNRAIEGHYAVLPVFIWAPEEEAPWAPGAASRWWLHQSLHELQRALVRLGSKLIFGMGVRIRNRIHDGVMRSRFSACAKKSKTSDSGCGIHSSR